MESNEYAEAGFYTKKEQSAGTLFFHFLFSHFGLFLIVSLYAVAGAYAFVAIELPHELRQYKIKQRKAEEVDDTMNYLSDFFWYYQETNITKYTKTVNSHLGKLEKFIILSVSKYNYDGTEDGWEYRWTFTKSLLLTMTIMSTIGYGHIYPVTSWGKFFCIIYSIIGCPLLLVFLGNLGNSMANAFIYIYSRCCCRWCRGRRNEEELPPNTSKKHRRLLIDDEVGKEDFMPTDRVDVPITVNLVVLFLYIMLGAVLFSFWEGWELGSSCYFTFVTLSTIGYGDMVPGNAILSGNDAGSATFKMLICVLYILLGMALLSMCISLMQEQLLNKCHWFAREIGLSGMPKDIKNNDKDKGNKDKKRKKKKKKKDKDHSSSLHDAENGPVPPDEGSPPSKIPSATASRTTSASSRGSPADSRPSSALSPSPSTRSTSPASRSPSPMPRAPSAGSRSLAPISMSPEPMPKSRSPSPMPRSPSSMSRISSASSDASTASLPQSPKLRRPGILDDF